MNIENLEKWHFELTEDACNSLLELVLKGQKRATSSSLAAFELGDESMPKEGELSVITDWDGNPRCVVRTKKLHILPYGEITYDLAKLEGEDETLESWKKGHERFFTREGEMLGYHFSEQMPVVFEEFEIVEIL
ncbi:ASCH domain-containing protein [Streptococcus equinus]|uniref:ASCH domain-containing protein n=1 Tax=Streptococcus equinus TaxID=1335 RepID=UPI003BF8A85C